jgi:hypothetical protein
MHMLFLKKIAMWCVLFALCTSKIHCKHLHIQKVNYKSRQGRGLELFLASTNRNMVGQRTCVSTRSAGVARVTKADAGATQA